MQESKKKQGCKYFMNREEKQKLKAEKKQQKAKEKQARKEVRSVYKETKGNKAREIKWGKLDNTAHLFPIIAGEGMTNVYRVAVILKEEIQQELLQQALDMVLPKFSVFNCRLRQGMFWYYFEENGKKSPTVHEEHTYPCRYIDEHRNRSYLFRVTYYGCRINLEVFHSLTDGNGALNFLKELMYQYLRLSHPELGEQYGNRLHKHTSLNTEDSFLQNYKKSRFEKSYKSEKAYILKGSLFPEGKMGIIHGHMSVDAVKRAAKKYDATINEFLVAVFIWAIYQEYLKGMPSKRPVTTSVPVNLRPFFNSVTTKNFFVMVTATFHPKAENQPFEDVIAEVKKSLREQITKEHLEEIFSYNVTGEKTMILRTIPLVFKKIGMKYVYNMAASANTATITNLGTIQVAPEYEGYVDHFSVILSRSKGQNLKMCLCSYNGMLTSTISSVMKDTKLQKAFYRYLVANDIPVTIESNGVYYE